MELVRKLQFACQGIAVCSLFVRHGSGLCSLSACFRRRRVVGGPRRPSWFIVLLLVGSLVPLLGFLRAFSLSWLAFFVNSLNPLGRSALSFLLSAGYFGSTPRPNHSILCLIRTIWRTVLDVEFAFVGALGAFWTRSRFTGVQTSLVGSIESVCFLFSGGRIVVDRGERLLASWPLSPPRRAF